MRYIKRFNEGRNLTDEEISEIVNLFSIFFDDVNWGITNYVHQVPEDGRIYYHIQKNHNYLFDSTIDDNIFGSGPESFKLSSKWDGRDIRWGKPRHMPDVPNREKYLHESLVINIRMSRNSPEEQRNNLFLDIHDFIEDIKHYYGYLCFVWRPEPTNIRIHISTKESNRFLGQKHR